MSYQSSTVSRRLFLLSTCSMIVAGCSVTSGRSNLKTGKASYAADFAADYAALPEEQFAIPAVPKGALKQKFQRKRVRYRTREKPGTVIVDTRQFFLFHVQKRGRAMRYGVGLGRAGFAWSGRAKIAWKRKWPKWTPPREMIARQPELEEL